ncbi:MULTISPECIES: CD1375 family protein [unclassified Psychrobacillus]
MAKIYYNLITANPPQWTIENVPTRWKSDVQTLLDADENAA